MSTKPISPTEDGEPTRADRVWDPSALERLYARHSKLVYGLALAILGSREDAEDLTQEVFASVYAPTVYDPSRGSVSAFLVSVARSRAIDRLRSRARSARLLKM